MNLGAYPPGCGGGLLLRNLLRFARVLRACGLPIGPGRVVSAAEAVRAVGIEDREDFYWTLHAVFVHRAADRELFDQAFHVFWRSPGLLDRLGELVLPERGAEALPQRELGRRVAEALAAGRSHLQASPALPSRVEPDAVLTWSPREVLRNKDFEQMSEEEVVQAKAAVAAMRPLLPRVSTRRLRIHPRGRRVDMRATLREALRAGPGSIPLIYSRHGKRPAPIVVICDVSGSMSRYSSLLLHFAHTLCALRERIHAFVFGTRLTNITRHLRERDVDTALQGVSRAVEDWSGGTRIGRCLHEFNRVWSRRVLGPGALVLLVSDGLDRGCRSGLGRRDGKAAEVLPTPALAQSSAALPRLRASGPGHAGDATLRPRTEKYPQPGQSGCVVRGVVHRAGCEEGDDSRRRVRFGPVISCSLLSAPGRISVSSMVTPGALMSGFRGANPVSATALSAMMDVGSSGTARPGTREDEMAQRRIATLEGDLLDVARQWLVGGRRAALATVVSTWGSSPRPAGSQLLVDEGGRFIGSVSGGCIEGAVVREALEVMESREPRLLEFGVSNEQAWEVGLACGGRVQVYVESLD